MFFVFLYKSSAESDQKFFSDQNFCRPKYFAIFGHFLPSFLLPIQKRLDYCLKNGAKKIKSIELDTQYENQIKQIKLGIYILNGTYISLADQTLHETLYSID